MDDINITGNATTIDNIAPFYFVQIIQTILFSLVCLVGITGNTLVIYVVVRYSKMQTVTNMYIVNLAIADEFFLIGIPVLIATILHGHWVFGHYACKAYMITTSINQFTSSILLCIMSADRYIAVCHPISSPKFRTPFISKVVSCFAWCCSILLIVPIIEHAQEIVGENGKSSCVIIWGASEVENFTLAIASNSSNSTFEELDSSPATIFTVYTFVFSFAIPLTLILFFYSQVLRKLKTVGPKNKSREKKRSHRKVTNLVSSVVLVYIICWAPYWVTQLAINNSNHNVTLTVTVTLVIYVVVRYSKMQTVTNMYIVNLAIADEFFLIGIPVLIATILHGHWVFGHYACKAYMITTSINQFTSSILLCIMSADRYIAVCHPISSPKFRTPFISKVVSCFAWCCSILLIVPIIEHAQEIVGENGKSSCVIIWGASEVENFTLAIASNSSNSTFEELDSSPATIFTVYTFVFSFAIPLTLILFFYSQVLRKLKTVGPKNKSREKKRSHRKVTNLVSSVVLVYIICWAPYWVTQLAINNSNHNVTLTVTVTLVIYVVVRYSKMQTVTNMYIVNLAIADEFFLIGIPVLIATILHGHWVFGHYACKAYMITTSINQFTSSILLCIMSADRYIAVCHPISSPKFRTPFISKVVSCFAWCCSILLIVPIIEHAQEIVGENGKSSCVIIWGASEVENFTLAIASNSSNSTFEELDSSPATIFTVYTFVFSFAIPLTLILFFYSQVLRKLKTVGPKNKSREKKRSHRKVTNLVSSVVLVYIICWAPYWVTQLAINNSNHNVTLNITLHLLASCLSYSNSAVNPILYAFLSDNFKKSFWKACTCAGNKDVNATLHLENSVFPKKSKQSSERYRPTRNTSICPNLEDDGDAPLVKGDPSTSATALTMTSRINIHLSDSRDNVTIKNGTATQSQPTSL